MHLSIGKLYVIATVEEIIIFNMTEIFLFLARSCKENIDAISITSVSEYIDLNIFTFYLL